MFLGSNWQCIIIGSYNGLVPNSREAIIWTNDGPIYWHIYASLGLSELNKQGSREVKKPLFSLLYVG